MRPIFTIHAGEFLVGEYIERKFKNLLVWIPSKDIGVDFLVTNKNDPSLSSISLQVKYSKDYKGTLAKTEFDKKLIAGGWVTLTRKKIANSTADYWVFIIVSHDRKIEPQFIVIPPKELLNRLTNIHGKLDSYNFYPNVMTKNRAIDSRGLENSDKEAFVSGFLEIGERDLSIYLNNWQMLKNLQNNS